MLNLTSVADLVHEISGDCTDCHDLSGNGVQMGGGFIVARSVAVLCQHSNRYAAFNMPYIPGWSVAQALIL